MTHLFRSAALAAAVALAGLAPAAQAADVSGSFTYTVQTPGTCGVQALVCARGTFKGSLAGSFTTTLLTLIPSTFVQQMIDFYTGTIVLNTASGAINCNLAGAQADSGDGEFGEICVITGGTGGYAGATGNLQLIGDSTLGKLLFLGLSGNGVYRGQVSTP